MLAAIVASNKNRSAWGWFALGALFGPVGFIAALVVKPLTTDPTNRTLGKADLTSRKPTHFQPTDLEQRLADKYDIKIESDRRGLLYRVDRKYFRSLDDAVEFYKQSQDYKTFGFVGTEVQTSVANDLKECPFCAETIKAKAKLCKHCKSKLD